MTPIISWFRGMNSLVLWHRSCPFRAYSALNAYSAAGLEPGEPDIPSVLVTGVQAASSASAMSASAHPLRTHEVKGPPGQRRRRVNCDAIDVRCANELVLRLEAVWTQKCVTIWAHHSGGVSGCDVVNFNMHYTEVREVDVP